MEKAMQYALVNGEKREASRGLIGICQGCDQQMIPKCGPIKVSHWAHKGERCDLWKEPETLWHRRWKNQFSPEWREVRHSAAEGQCHIADIRTEHGLVIECQHSPIPAAERVAREKFYSANGRMVWIVNGGRYKTARSRLIKSQASWGRTSIQGFSIVLWPEECFPEAWIESTVPVFFDFDDDPSETLQVVDGVLWCLLPGRAESRAVVAKVSRAQFVDLARNNGDFIALNGAVERIAAEIRHSREIEVRRMQPLPAWRIAADRRRRRNPF
jgi:competence protein CoiA